MQAPPKRQPQVHLSKFSRSLHAHLANIDLAPQRFFHPSRLSETRLMIGWLSVQQPLDLFPTGPNFLIQPRQLPKSSDNVPARTASPAHGFDQSPIFVSLPFADTAVPAQIHEKTLGKKTQIGR